MILRCPLFARDDCDRDFKVPDEVVTTWSEILHHLQGWPHYRSYMEALVVVPLAEEVEA